MREYRVIDVYSDELKKIKKIYLYLPQNYETSDENYPVLYMHDGQNLFDDQTAYHKRSWRILEELEAREDWKNRLIIVGIQSDNQRTDELVPYDVTFEGDKNVYGGKANQYLDFISYTLKPYIDQRFRTLKDPYNTAIMGSSFGGVNSFYAALQYHHIFGRFGCVSNAFHYGFFDKIKKDLSRSDISSIYKMHLDFGTKESSNGIENQGYIDSNKEIYELVLKQLHDHQVRLVVVEDGKHHERDWQKRFIDIISYLFTN